MDNKKHNHTCNICGSTYYACNDCDNKNYLTWRAICCCPSHFQIYSIVSEYNAGVLSKEQAYDFLMTLNLSDDDINKLRESVSVIVYSIIKNKDRLAEQENTTKKSRKKTATTEEE